MPQTMFELSQDLELATDLLRRREEDGFNPPRPKKSSEAQLEQDLRLLAQQRLVHNDHPELTGDAGLCLLEAPCLGQRPTRNARCKTRPPGIGGRL